MSQRLPSCSLTPSNASDTSPISEPHQGCWCPPIVRSKGFRASNVPYIGLSLGNIPLVATVDSGQGAWYDLQAFPEPLFSLAQHLREE